MKYTGDSGVVASAKRQVCAVLFLYEFPLVGALGRLWTDRQTCLSLWARLVAFELAVVASVGIIRHEADEIVLTARRLIGVEIIYRGSPPSCGRFHIVR